jgi:hypothetical protein
MNNGNDNRYPYYGGLSPYNVTYVHLFNPGTPIRECELGLAPIISQQNNRRHVRNSLGVCYLIIQHLTEFFLRRPLETNGLTYMSTLRIREVVFSCTEHPPLRAGTPSDDDYVPNHDSSANEGSDGEVFYSD